jgi:histidyl-tRNA synthetase
VLAEEAEPVLLRLASELRAAGLRVGVYLGGSGKIAKQLKWANDQRARYAALLGRRELAENMATVRDMTSGEQHQVPLTEAADWLRAHVAR